MRPLFPGLLGMASVLLLSACASVPASGPDSWGGPAIRREIAKQSPDPEKLYAVCETMALYGEYVGDARAAGAPVNRAMTDASDRLVRRSDAEPGDGLDLNARVFAVLAYRLDEDHTPQSIGAYTLLACVTIHGLKKTMPVDLRSEQAVNERLRICAESSTGRDQLGACVIRQLGPVVTDGFKGS